MSVTCHHGWCVAAWIDDISLDCASVYNIVCSECRNHVANDHWQMKVFFFPTFTQLFSIPLVFIHVASELDTIRADSGQATRCIHSFDLTAHRHEMILEALTFARRARLMRSLSFRKAALRGKDWMSVKRSCSSASNNFLLSGTSKGWAQNEPMYTRTTWREGQHIDTWADSHPHQWCWWHSDVGGKNKQRPKVHLRNASGHMR